jgi:hypothetical protein
MCRKVILRLFALKSKLMENSWLHCKSGPHKNGIRKSNRITYDHIMGIKRFEADIVIIKKRNTNFLF